MNKKISGLLSIVLSILILLYFETVTYNIIDIIGININTYSIFIQTTINIIIKLIMCFLIYLLFKKDFKNSYSSNNLLKKIFTFILSLLAITLITYLFEYVVKFIGKIFNISILEKNFYNIFDQNLSYSLIIKIIIDYLINPYLYCSVIILSVNKICKKNDTFILLSGLLASLVYAIKLSGTLGYVMINSLSTFVLFSMLSFMYRKENSIWFTIILYSFYLLSNIIIINYIGW